MVINVNLLDIAQSTLWTNPPDYTLMEKTSRLT